MKDVGLKPCIEDIAKNTVLNDQKNATTTTSEGFHYAASWDVQNQSTITFFVASMIIWILQHRLLRLKHFMFKYINFDNKHSLQVELPHCLCPSLALWRREKSLQALRVLAFHWEQLVRLIL
jgi:hypothetical protein